MTAPINDLCVSLDSQVYLNLVPGEVCVIFRRKPLSAKDLTRKKHSIPKLWTGTASKRKVIASLAAYTRRAPGSDRAISNIHCQLLPGMEDL